MAQTTIEWTATQLPDGSSLPGFSFNPWVGCQEVSDACKNCYARDFMTKKPRWATAWSGDRFRTSADYWKQPLRWNAQAAASGIRRKVFCASLADVFDNQVDPAWRVDLWRLIDETPGLDWLLLTKRPQNALKMIIAARRGIMGTDIAERHVSWAWDNVWLGTTVENQEEADRRIPHLLAVPAAVHFLSCEPLLGYIDLSNWVGIDWVIVGGESGRERRPMPLEAARILRDQCEVQGIKFFGKQLDKVTPLPDDLMVREFPV